MKTSTAIALALATSLSGSLAAYAQTEQPTVHHHYHVHHYRAASCRSSPLRGAQPSHAASAGGRYGSGPSGGAVWLGSCRISRPIPMARATKTD